MYIYIYSLKIASYLTKNETFLVMWLNGYWHCHCHNSCSKCPQTLEYGHAIGQLHCWRCCGTSHAKHTLSTRPGATQSHMDHGIFEPTNLNHGLTESTIPSSCLFHIIWRELSVSGAFVFHNLFNGRSKRRQVLFQRGARGRSDHVCYGRRVGVWLVGSSNIPSHRPVS